MKKAKMGWIGAT